MRVELLAQTDVGGLPRSRVGDVLNRALADTNFDRFRFVVAYMRVSGISRLATAIAGLRGRGGSVSGAVGLDDGVTSSEALLALLGLSSTSTVFHTVSGFIFHPKLYLLSGPKHGKVVIGSPNLTRDGLYRNIEAATAIDFDLDSEDDRAAFASYERFADAFLDHANPNVKRLTAGLVPRLERLELTKSEAASLDPEVPKRRGKGGKQTKKVEQLFPRLRAPEPPAPPPSPTGIRPRPRSNRGAAATAASHSTFVMQLSKFDASHDGDTDGTPEMLVPKEAVGFFPRLRRGKTYREVFFDLLVNTPSGIERPDTRLWYYTTNSEYRLRMRKYIRRLLTFEEGDILVVTRLPAGSDPAFEFTIIRADDDQHAHFLSLCDRRAADDESASSDGKRFGLH